MKSLTIIVILLMGLLPQLSVAHHSFGLFSEEVSQVEGVIVDVFWRNPHVILTLEARAETVQGPGRWTLEAAAVYVLERRGISKDLFSAGDTIRVTGRANQYGEKKLWIHSILLPNSKEVLMIGGVEPYWTRDTIGGDVSILVVDAASEGQGIFRVWSQPVIRPIDYGSDLPYISWPGEEGPEWIARLYDFAKGCEPTGMPGVMATPYPFDFTDQGDTIRLRGFSNNALIDRTIHLIDETTNTPGIMGRSMGRWEDNKLIVETTSIDWPYFNDSTGLEQSDDLVVVEELELSSDQSRLDYRMIVTDPSLFTEPAVVVDLYWLALGESRVVPTVCEN